MAVHRIQELLGLMQKNLECSICLELLKNPVATKCDHHFCRFCIIEFLGNKRSAPCPLCKQPITKRSLQEKREWSGIVNGVNSLISAFQQDSGTIYSPPAGPQSFFPCTPETINSKPDNKAKTRRNVRNSKRSCKSSVEEVSSVAPVSASAGSDDIFAVPSTVSHRSSRLKKQPAASSITASPSTVSSTTTSPSAAGPESETVAAPRDDDIHEGVLQYLEEGSCGFETNYHEETTTQSRAEDIEPDEGISRRTTRSDQKDRAVRKSRKSKASKKTETFVCEENQSENSELTAKNRDQNNALVVSELNKKNVENRAQLDKENPPEIITTRQQKKSSGDQPRCGLGYYSQNSSDSSISSTQQFLQPRPVVTRTYGRRSGSKSSSEQKVTDWIAAFPADQLNSENNQTVSDQTLLQDENKRRDQSVDKQNPVEIQENKTVGRDSSIIVITDDQNIPEEDDNSTLEKEDSIKEGKIEQVQSSNVPEPDEEFMLTPPIRKKPIFKRGGAQAGKDADSPKTLQHENSPPTADPYAFVVGHTPVAKSKKRGRPRSKEKKGKLVCVQPLNLSTNEKKTVRFADASFIETAGGSFIEDNRQEKATVSDALHAPEKQKEISMAEADTLFVAGVEMDEDLVPSAPETKSKSRSKSLSKTLKKTGASVEGTPTQQKKSKKRNSNKKNSHEEQKVQEEQTRELASWIGQAEDHDLLFSTQDAHASIESMEETSGEKDDLDIVDNVTLSAEPDEIIALASEEDDSNDGICLVGPIVDNRSERVSPSQQNRNFDAVLVNEPFPDKNKLPSNKTKPVETHGDSASLKDADLLSKEKMSSPPTKQIPSPVQAKSKQGRFTLPLPSEGEESVRTDPDVAETQASSLESQTSSNVVLPSPRVGSVLPKTSTPVLQTARQTRTTRRGLAQHKVGAAADGKDQTVLAESGPPKAKSSRKENMSDAVGAELSDFPDAVDTRKQKKNLSEPVLEPVLNPSLPLPVLSNKRSRSAEKHKMLSLTAQQHAAEPPKRSSGRLALKKGGSAASSPSVIAVPSSCTEENCSGTVISPSGPQGKRVSERIVAEHDSDVQTCIPETAESKHLSSRSPPPVKKSSSSSAEINPEKRVTTRTRNRQHLSSCVDESVTHSKSAEKPVTDQLPFEEPEELQAVEMDRVVVSDEPGEHADTGSRDKDLIQKTEMIGPVEEIEMIGLTLEDNGCPDAAAEADNSSSATDDLDIIPAEDEFEEPDMSLQPEEIQQRFSSGVPSQDSLFHTSPRASVETHYVSEPCQGTSKKAVQSSSTNEDSLPRKDDVAGNRAKKSSEAEEKGIQKSSGNNTGEADRSFCEASQMEGAVDSAVTRVPESLDVEGGSSVTQTPSDNSWTQQGVTNHNQTQISSPSSQAVRKNSPHLQQGYSKLRRFRQKEAQRLKEKDNFSGCDDNSEIRAPSQSKTDPFSSATASPSQSLLQPVHAAMKPILSVVSSSVQNAKATAVSSPSVDVAANPLTGPNHTEESNNKRLTAKQADAKDEESSVSPAAYSPALANQPASVDEDQTLANDQVSTEDPVLESVEQEEGLRQEAGESENVYEKEEDKISDEERDKGLGQEEGNRAKLLVQDTQISQSAEDQSIPLLPQEVILESLPEEEELTPEQNGQNQFTSQDVSSHENISETAHHSQHKLSDALCASASSNLDLKSPRQQVSILEQPHPQQEERDPLHAAEVMNKGALSQNSKATLNSSVDKKRKLQNQEDSSKAKLAKSPDNGLGTPDLPLESPSSISSRVISSAPPRTTSFPSDSDDDDAVLIVRRTKRKCFSLDGSPLKAQTPTSTKRRRYGRRRKIVSERLDIQTDDVRESDDGRCVDVTEDDGEKKSVKEDHTHLSGSSKGRDACQGEKTEHQQDSEILSQQGPASGLQSKYTEVSEKENNSDERRDDCHASSKISPGQRRRTARGLARRSNTPPADYIPTSHSDKQNTPTVPQTASARQANISASTDDIASEMEEAASGMKHANRQHTESTAIRADLTEHRNVIHMHVEISDDEEPMEVDHADALLDDETVEDEDAVFRRNFSLNKHKVSPSAFHVKAHEDEENGDQPEESSGEEEIERESNNQRSDSSRKGEEQYGSAEKPVIITQSSVRSLSSLRGTTEDLTIPPADFDLRFDSDEDEDVPDEPQSTPKQQLEKTTDQNPNMHNERDDDTEDQACLIKSTGRDDDRDAEEHVQEFVDEAKMCSDDVTSKRRRSQRVKQKTSSAPNQKQSSASQEDSEEEEVMKKRKKSKRVISSDSDSDQHSGAESESSFHLNFTSSSAMSSQSEVLTTQERSKMEADLERLRKEIAETEAILQGRSSSAKSDSAGDSADINSSKPHRSDSRSRSRTRDSSDDDDEVSSGVQARSEGKGKRSVSKRSQSRSKKSRRRPRISSDDEEQEEKEDESTGPKQQLMDAYVYDVSEVVASAVDDGLSKAQAVSHSPVQVPNKKVKNRADVSDEDSSDLFLSPLSPSPPPPTKHSLARKESSAQPRSLFSADFPIPTGNNSVTKVRQSLDFVVSRPDNVENPQTSADADCSKYDDIQDSEESDLESSGCVKKIPESQFSASGGNSVMPQSDCERIKARSDNAQVTSNENRSSSSGGVCTIESSGSPLPSPLNDRNDLLAAEEHFSGEQNDNSVDEDLPRWKRRKIGFISSGLDQEKAGRLRKLAEMNECKVYSKFNKSVTHVIMKTNTDSRVCERTLKYFQGIAGQCWVLSVDWMTDSLQAGHFVPEKDYEIQGDTVKGENHHGPGASRRCSSPLLVGFAFASVGVSPDMSKKELNQLLTLTGAEVVEDPWDLASHAAKHKLVLRCVDSDAQPPTPAEIELFNGQYKHFGLVTVAREWILDSICTYHLQPLEDYVFNTCKDLSLPF